MTPPADAELHDPGNYLGRIDRLWAFLSIDDGCAAPLGPMGMPFPLIAADKRRIDSMKPMARVIAAKFGKPVRLAKFNSREDVEMYQP